ncbi:MAG: hypothetical protein R3E94_05730 [Burkholderiaceae bacterium]
MAINGYVRNAGMRWLAAPVLAFGLIACGGGNDDPVAGDPAADPVSPYVGTWLSRCVAESGLSAHLRADFLKTGTQSLAGDVLVFYYLGTSCSGPSVDDDRVLSNLQLTLDGTGVVAGLAAERFIGTSNEGNAHVVMAVNGNQLRIGDPDASKDADGFPTAFLDETLTRQ